MLTLVAEPLSQIRPEKVRWLWQPYIPRGKLVLLDGDPGIGKSFLTIDLAARFSRGDTIPGEAPPDRPQVTLLLGAEDNAADTIRPRAEAAGADLDRVIVVTGAESLRLPHDLPAVEDLIRERRADLVVIDPISAFLVPTAAYSDSGVRVALTALAHCAERHDCTILLVRHLRKERAGKAIHRGVGSVGIIGTVRVGLIAARHPTEPDLRVLAVTKTNLAILPPAIRFRLRTDEPARMGITWEARLDVPADALGLPAAVPLRPRDRAANWLTEQLAAGPRKTTELFAAAADAGIPERTLLRAKCDLNVKLHIHYDRKRSKAWYWYDPCAPWPPTAPFPKPKPTDLPPIEDLF